MKRIVIIEGNVSSLSCHHAEYAAIISSDKEDVVLDITPAAADQIGASFREPMRVVVEIGAAEIPLGGLKDAVREDLIHALAAARHAADEYQRENEALVKSSEGLRAGLNTHRAPFDPERHITKATVAKWLEDDARSSDRAASLQRTLKNTDASNMMTSGAADTRAIIDRINAHKEPA